MVGTMAGTTHSTIGTDHIVGIGVGVHIGVGIPIGVGTFRSIGATRTLITITTHHITIIRHTMAA